VNAVKNLPLDIGNDLAGVLLVPVPVQVLRHRTELDQEVPGQVIGLSLAALFLPKPEQGRFVLAHDDPGIRAAYKGTPLRMILHANLLRHMITILSYDDNLVNMQSRRMTNISGAQIRAARALLRWSAADLVRESGVSPATIHRAESTDGKTTMTFANASAIRRALENAGVELIEENGGGLGARLRRGLELIDENGGGPGVRLRKPDKPRR
jgi:hypothetical protein